MSIVPATYFSTAIRHAQHMLGDSGDGISLVALAQLRTAYEVLAANAEALQSGPVFQIGACDQPPFGYAPVIDLSRLPSPPEKAHRHFSGAVAAWSPQQYDHLVIVGVGR